LSKIFKSAKVVLDDKAFVLSNKFEMPESAAVEEANEWSLSDAAEQAVEDARAEAQKIYDEADKEASEKLKDAQKSAESIIADAYDQAKGIMEKAQEEGYRDGYNQGIEESQKEADAIIGQAQQIKEEWVRERAELFEQSEPEMIGLVLDTLEKILGKHVNEDETLIESIMRLGISRITKTAHLAVRVSSEDYAHAMAVKPMILAISDKVDDIEIKRDPSLENGSCIIETDSGNIDSSVWKQFEQVKTMFQSMLKGEADA